MTTHASHLGLGDIVMCERGRRVAGSFTRWWEYGHYDPAASSPEVTIVAVHGFRGDHHGLEPVLACLPHDFRERVRIISPDLPGFGQSQPFPDRAHDIAGYADWLGEFLRTLHPSGRIVLVGHSFGSIIVAAAMANGLPVDGCVLINPIGAPALQGPRRVLTGAAALYYRLGASLPERAGVGLLKNPAIVRGMSAAMAKTRDPALRRFIHDQHRLYFSSFASREVVLEAFRASISHDVSEYAADISVPVLLIAASRDDITPLPAVRRLATLLPNPRLHVIDGVGHLIHYETPAEAATQLVDFATELVQQSLKVA